MKIEIFNNREYTALHRMNLLDVFESTGKVGDFYMVVSGERLISLETGEVIDFSQYYGQVGNVGYLKVAKLNIYEDEEKFNEN